MSSETGIQGRDGVGWINAHRPVGLVLVRDGKAQEPKVANSTCNENGFCLRHCGQRKLGHGSQSSGPECLGVVVTVGGKVTWFPQLGSHGNVEAAREGSALSPAPG